MLNRTSVTSEPKKDVNASVDFLLTVVNGHLLSAACKILGVTTLSSPINLPPSFYKKSPKEQYTYLQSIAAQVVDQFTLINGALTGDSVMETNDGAFNYGKILCHFGSLVIEIRDAWAEGDGERMIRCWHLLLPHFKVADRRKYALEALQLQFQMQATLSPHQAHQLMWNRFINTNGGLGHNIPCDLHNEHVNKLVKSIIKNQGSNFTEVALQRAARSVTTLESICHQFDQQANIPPVTHSHSSKSIEKDVEKVMGVVLKNDLLLVKSDRSSHSSYQNMKTNPLSKWDLTKTKK